MTTPRILISTASRYREQGLRRVDSVGGVNYAEAILKTGGLPYFLANVDPDTASAFIEGADGLLLSGGADVDPRHFGQPPHPGLGLVDEKRDLFELELYRAAKAKGVPILGVCRGIQLINVAEGGTLQQHLPALATTQQHSQRSIDGTPFHAVRLEPGSLLADAYGSTTIYTNSYHHQAVEALGQGLRATAWAEDGVTEGLEGTGDAFVLGVQWHPEMSFAAYPDHLAPFAAFMTRVLQRDAAQRQTLRV